MEQTTLTDRELLAALIGQRQAERLYQGSLASLLLKESGTGGGYGKLSAAKEIMRRALKEELKKRTSINRPDKVRDYLRLVFAGKEREVFLLVLLDAHHRVIEAIELFLGTLNQANVYPREVVKSALKYNAAGVIIAHNHPSGSAEPSSDDLATTMKLKQALALIDVKVLDHFVVAGNECLSFAERGII